MKKEKGLKIRSCVWLLLVNEDKLLDRKYHLGICKKQVIIGILASRYTEVSHAIIGHQLIRHSLWGLFQSEIEMRHGSTPCFNIQDGLRITTTLRTGHRWSERPSDPRTCQHRCSQDRFRSWFPIRRIWRGEDRLKRGDQQLLRPTDHIACSHWMQSIRWPFLRGEIRHRN
jgi:hypothetical protein